MQLCPNKLSRFPIHSHGKSVLSSINFNLNAWEGFINDIKQDLAENKSWLKVVCTCVNINTVMWRYVHNLACFTLEQIRRKLNTVIKNNPYGTLQISKLYTLLGLQKSFKTFLGCFIVWYEMFTITWQRLLLQLEDQLVSLRVFILGLWLYLVWCVRFKTRIQLCNNTTHELVYLYFFYSPLKHEVSLWLHPIITNSLLG